MGHGGYSVTNSVARAALNSYDTKSAREIFKQREINNAMSPNGITVRESRDSDEHPNSFPIVLALDETGSMGSVPHFLVKKGFTQIMGKIIEGGEKDPQVLFLGIGDHECDQAPLQVGQFESSDELLEKWLTDVFLEGNGGGNGGESYLLAWFFAGNYTSTDSFEKRGRKGLLFTIGDEPTLMELPKEVQKGLMGKGQYSNQTAAELLEKASETFNVFHIHCAFTTSGSRKHVIDGWKELMADNLLIVNKQEEVAKVIAETVLAHSKSTNVAVKPSKKKTSAAEGVADEEIL